MSYKDKYQRKNSITLCFNDNEYDIAKEFASHMNMPLATALRTIITTRQNEILKDIRKKTKSKSNADLVYELNKIGVNINQISRAINTDIEKFISHDFAEDFISVFENIISDIELIKSKI